MAEHFADRLIGAVERKGSPICVGIDPIVGSMPDAVFEFTTRVLKIVAPHVPCVKFQSAYFEQFHSEGVEAYFNLIQEAIELGLIVIGDVKRGDIGSTASAYAAGHLAEAALSASDEIATPDAITVNPMLGMDTLEPFVTTASELGKGLFVLVRTSNPGSAELQDVKLADGRTWSEMVAEKLAAIAERNLGARGWSSIGAVVGATQTHTMTSIRRRLPQSIFLLPGYGTQGATAEMTREAFRDGVGGLVSASRSILYAHKEGKYAGLSWEQATERAVMDMREDLRGVLGG